MKAIFLVPFFLVLSIINLCGQDMDCQRFRDGQFRSVIAQTQEDDLPKDENGVITLRDGDIQTEIIDGVFVEFKVDWINDCSYTLIPTKDAIAMLVDFPENAVLTVEILEVRPEFYFQRVTSNFTNSDTYYQVYKIDSEEDVKAKIDALEANPIEGQIETASSLLVFMHEKDYESAISLFSQEQQLIIREFQKDKDVFDMWCFNWTMGEAEFVEYIKKIQAENGVFIFEDDIWKVDER